MYIETDFQTTEKILRKYFKDTRKLRIWKASAQNRREYKEKLQARINSGIVVSFCDSLGSSALSLAVPSNKQPPKGIDACIDKAGEIYNNLLSELRTTELDIEVTEGQIEKLEQEMFCISEVVKIINAEAMQVLKKRLDENKSFETIGDEMRKSTTATFEFYKKSINDISNWLKYTQEK